MASKKLEFGSAPIQKCPIGFIPKHMVETIVGDIGEIDLSNLPSNDIIELSCLYISQHFKFTNDWDKDLAIDNYRTNMNYLIGKLDEDGNQIPNIEGVKENISIIQHYLQDLNSELDQLKR